MEKITNLEELNSLILPCFRKGVYTNCFFDIEEYKVFLKEESLFFEKSGNNLFLIRNLDEVNYIYFYLNSFEEINLPNNSVVEITEPKEEVIEFFEKLGFIKCVERFEMLLKDTSKVNQIETKLASLEEISQIREIIIANFDKFYGRIPSLEELKRQSVIISYDEEKNINGIVHFKTNNSISNIIHVAVLSEFRGKGIGKKILTGYINNQKENCKEFRLWVNNDNKVAQDFYKKHGYNFTGRKSVVLTKKGELKNGKIN